MKENKHATFDLAIAWNWEFDSDFISGIEQECSRRRIRTYRIDTSHLPEILKKLKNKEITFSAFFDRATDADPEFLPLVKWMEENASILINPYHQVIHAIDKATMHLEFIACGLEVPDTIILPPFNEQRTIRIDNERLKRLGFPFVIKPANTTGGGTGILLNATTVEEILNTRQEHKNDKYLVQRTIIPKQLDAKRGWFRVYYAFGEIIPCWWDDKTHRYSELSPGEESKYGLKKLTETMGTIQGICKLDFFSSEIVSADDDKFIVVDYVNEVCDMRLQSKYYNGAPDSIVHRIEGLISGYIEKHLQNHTDKR